MATSPPSDNRALRWRLALVLALFAAGGAMMMSGVRPDAMPGADWFGGSRQRLVLADLAYRMGEVLETLGYGLPGELSGDAWTLKEWAVAEYERQALGRSANPAAWQRLGFIYGDRGYRRQAHDALARAASIDGVRARPLFTAAAVYEEEASVRRLAQIDPRVLRDQEAWLADMALIAWAERTGDEAQLRQFRAERARRVETFAMVLALLALFYGGIVLVGLVVLLFMLVRWLFTLPRRPAGPRLLPTPWEPLDALEAAGALFLTMVVVGVVAGIVQGLPAVARTAPLARLALVCVQYLLQTGLVLAVVWLRLPVRPGLKLPALGFHGRPVAPYILRGFVGYGVTLCLMGLTLVLFGKGASTSAWLLVTGMGDPLLAAIRQPAAALALGLFVCVLVPTVEEAVFRGFIYPGLRRTLPVAPATLGSALLFALLHHNMAAVVPVALIGVVLAQLYERTRSLTPCIVCHALHNLLVFGLILLAQ